MDEGLELGSTAAAPAPGGAHAVDAQGARYVRELRAFTPGNEIRFLRDGLEAYPEMLEAITGATRSVHLETFIFADDRTGHRFARALAQAAERGVEVTVLYDALGSWRSHRGFFKAMRRRAIKVRAFNPLAPWRGPSSMLRRDHRKLLVVDGRTAFVGGINISDAWAPGGGNWRDDVMRIDGPAVAPLDGIFRATWRSAVRGALWRKPELAEPEGPIEPSAPLGDVAVAIFAARRAIHQAYLHAIGKATHSVLLASCYFVPDRAILRALRRARMRGVEVSLILSGQSDHYSVQQAGRALYGRLLRWGVGIYEWQERVFHAKSAVVDGTWGTTGSFNLDGWSLYRNHELNAVFSEARHGQVLEEALRRDIALCRPVTLEAWRARPRLRRFFEWFFGMFARWL